MPDYTNVPLRPGSVIVERHVYTTQRGKLGTQWLAERVDADGEVRVVKVCSTRHEALVALDA